ncbi:hypothetical protein [Paraburkholderia sp. MM5477-R1]|uniref:hypothetical protein n=1 Tax=Paraburkholderia sp. MM5477-R1 TaxID=2991062 RepID=UPI003D1B849F
MDELAAFYSGVRRSISEAIGLMSRELDETTLAVVEDALENEWRIALIADLSGGMVVALLDARGRIGPLLGSVNDRGRERIYRLQRTQNKGLTNGENLPYRDRERRQPRRDGQAPAAPAHSA